MTCQSGWHLRDCNSLEDTAPSLELSLKVKGRSERKSEELLRSIWLLISGWQLRLGRYMCLYSWRWEKRNFCVHFLKLLWPCGHLDPTSKLQWSAFLNYIHFSLNWVITVATIPQPKNEDDLFTYFKHTPHFPNYHLQEQFNVKNLNTYVKL